MPTELAPIDVEGSATPAPEPAAPAGPAPTTAIQTEPGRVALVADGGEVQSIPQENVARAIDQFGYRPATASEYRVARDGFAGTARASLGGALRGATFGVSDPLAVAAGDLFEDGGGSKVRKTLDEDREDHPTASIVSELAGSLAPLAIGLPPEGAAIDLGEGIFARAGARVLAAAPREFAIGGAMGLGHQLTEDTLGDHDLVAGKYLASGLEGGLVNMLLGAGLLAGGGAIADRLLTSGEGTVGGLAGRAVDKLRATAEEQAAKAAFPASSLAAGEMQRLGATAEEQQIRVRQVGRTLLDEGIVTPMATKATIAERTTARVSEVGDELGALRKGFDRTGVKPDAQAVFDRIKTEVLEPLVARAFSAAEQASVMPYVVEMGRIVDKSGGEFKSFEQLFDLRRALDKKLDPKLWQKLPGTAPAGFEELGQIRGILESEFEKAADRAASIQGDQTANRYRIAKALFSDLKTAEKWATKGAAREAQNRAISLTDTIAAGAGLASGHGALAIPALVANKAMRTYGNQVAAVALDRISRLEILQRAATAFDAKLAAATKSFYREGSTPALPKRRPAITPAERVALRTALQNPTALTEHVGDIVAKTGLTEAAPNVAGAMAQTLMRAGMWVMNNMPPEPAPVGFSFGPPKPRPLGPRGQMELDRALDALDVDKTLYDVAHGRMTHQQVEALKFVNPQLYTAIQSSLREYGQENDPHISTQQEVALSIAFGTPVSSYTRGATIRGFQQAFAQGATPDDPASAGGQPGKPIGTGPNPQTAQALMSPTDRAEAESGL